TPDMIFVCHACKAIIEPEEAEVTTLKKYLLNPTFIPELEPLIQQPSHHANLPKQPTSQHPTAPPNLPSPSQPQPDPLLHEPEPDEEITEPALPLVTPQNTQPDIVSTDETQLLEELHTLERAFKEDTITEAEYDRRFVKLRLQLRQLRNQSTL
ncbi:MAG: hypothetical protein Q6361_00435, partial [Candidatus Hermodarchaeota archaeon]|nr:hypothetical protein [Candidatus Hermodarchaeota archaeon]